MPVPTGDLASAESALMSFFDLDGAPSINMAAGFRGTWGTPPDTTEQIVVDLPGKQLRTLIYHLRTEFPMTDALCAKGFPPRWGAFALTEALRGLYHNDLVTPLDEHIALARASAPLTDWADWPQTRRNIAASHGTPLPTGRTQ